MDSFLLAPPALESINPILSEATSITPDDKLLRSVLPPPPLAFVPLTKNIDTVERPPSVSELFSAISSEEDASILPTILT